MGSLSARRLAERLSRGRRFWRRRPPELSRPPLLVTRVFDYESGVECVAGSPVGMNLIARPL